MGSFSVWHWLIVLIIIMLVFGTKKLRNIGSDLGGAVRNFKDSMNDGQNLNKDQQNSNENNSASNTGEKTINVDPKDVKKS